MYELYGIEIGRRTSDPSLLLYQTGAGGSVPTNFCLWCAVGDAGVVLIDTGFDVAEAHRRGVEAPIPTEAALARIGRRLSDVTAVIATHLHWDHFSAVPGLEHAKCHVQAVELEHFASPVARRTAIARYAADRGDVARIADRDGFAVADGACEPLPGISVQPAGGHTLGLQVVTVQTAGGPAVVCSDAAPLYRNVAEDVPPGIVVDLIAALGALDLIRAVEQSGAQLLPGHDPLVMTRFERVANGVVRL